MLVVGNPQEHTEAPPERPRTWLFAVLIGILVALLVGAIVVARPEWLAGPPEIGSPPSSLTNEESVWCARNRDAVFAAVAETDEIGPLVVPGEAELWEFWTTDEWLSEPRETWSDRERDSYDRMCRIAVTSS